MTVGVGTVDEAARTLVLARRDVSCVRPSMARVGDLSQAYAIAAAVDDEWRGAGAVPNGIKIGFTNRAKWSQLNLTGPFWGRTYAGTTHDADSGPFDLGGCVAARIEAEVIVGLSHDLAPGAGTEQVARALAWAALGFEVVDSHSEGWKVSPAELIADFGGHAGLVIGQRCVLTEQETLALGQLEISLRCGSDDPLRGRGDEVLGGPVSAITALLAGPDAPRLRAGSIVSTGSLTGGAHAVRPGQVWALDAVNGPLASTAVSFTTSRG